jgi:hypothetical protein
MHRAFPLISSLLIVEKYKYTFYRKRRDVTWVDSRYPIIKLKVKLAYICFVKTFCLLDRLESPNSKDRNIGMEIPSKLLGKNNHTNII